MDKKLDHKIIEVSPNGAIIALMAGKRLQSGKADNALSLTPLYLKESTAKAYRNKDVSTDNKD